jgi:cyanate permease
MKYFILLPVATVILALLKLFGLIGLSWWWIVSIMPIAFIIGLLYEIIHSLCFKYETRRP